MRSSLVIARLLPLAQAFPQILPRGTSGNASSLWDIANGTNTTTGPLGGTLITDPVRLRAFTALHNQALESLNNGSALPVAIPANAGQTNGLTERQDPGTILIAGLFILLAELGADVDQVLIEIAKLFSGETTEWWKQTSRCRTHFQTHSGGEEKIEIFAKGSSHVTNETDSK